MPTLVPAPSRPSSLEQLQRLARDFDIVPRLIQRNYLGDLFTEVSQLIHQVGSNGGTKGGARIPFAAFLLVLGKVAVASFGGNDGRIASEPEVRRHTSERGLPRCAVCAVCAVRSPRCPAGQRCSLASFLITTITVYRDRFCWLPVWVSGVQAHSLLQWMDRSDGKDKIRRSSATIPMIRLFHVSRQLMTP